MRAATLKLEQQLMRAPEKAELAAEMGITLTELLTTTDQGGTALIRCLISTESHCARVRKTSDRFPVCEQLCDRARIGFFDDLPCAPVDARQLGR